MNISGLLYGTKLLDIVEFPHSEVLGSEASNQQIQDLITRHGEVFIKPIFQGGIGKKGKAGLVGRAKDLKTAIKYRL